LNPKRVPTMATAMPTGIMNTSPNELALARLLQLVSPSLPIGGYTYSQGIEWAVEAQWIGNQVELQLWLDGVMQTNLCYLELPILQRMLAAWSLRDLTQLEHWNEVLIASRETAELRLEEANRARAFYGVLKSLEPSADEYQLILRQSHIAGYSFACERWGIDFERAACGWLWSWLENLVLSAVKIIPLGQTAGQQIIFSLGAFIPEVVAAAEAVADDEIGASSMAQAIASARHETQYTRLFRS
jgi:urease accessory protein